MQSWWIWETYAKSIFLKKSYQAELFSMGEKKISLWAHLKIRVTLTWLQHAYLITHVNTLTDELNNLDTT